MAVIVCCLTEELGDIINSRVTFFRYSKLALSRDLVMQKFQFESEIERQQRHRKT